MSFPELVKSNVRRKAHMSCCLCHTIGVEIHHVIPECENGPDTVDNAAPLCPTCHEVYGGNPQKRKFIREARELWYEICARRYAADLDRLKRIEKKLDQLLVAQSPFDVGSVASMGDVLRAIYDSRERNVSEDDIDFFYLAVFGGVIGDESFEETKRIFVEKFGTETARRICGYVLSGYDIAFGSGFTSEELFQAVNATFIVMMGLVYNREINASEDSLVLNVDSSGTIRYRIASQLSDACTSTSDGKGAESL